MNYERNVKKKIDQKDRNIKHLKFHFGNIVGIYSTIKAK